MVVEFKSSSFASSGSSYRVIGGEPASPMITFYIFKKKKGKKKRKQSPRNYVSMVDADL